MADARATVLPWPLEPDRVARASFSHSFRGFDPTEVRSFLARLAGELAALRAREAELSARVSELEHRRPAAPANFDEHQLTELLGAEAARVLDAAREAANAIRTNADRHAGELLDEARSDAEQQRAGAADYVAEQRAEADAEAARVLEASEAEAERLVREAEAALEEAGRQAEERLDAAREDGRRMVAEARAVRERILSDMARRRNHARQQLEKLRAGRERLLDAIETVRALAEEAGGELNGSLVEARLAGERASRQVDVDAIPSLNELEAEVALAKDAGLIDIDAIERELAAEGTPTGAGVGLDAEAAGPGADGSDDSSTDGASTVDLHPVAGDEVTGPVLDLDGGEAEGIELIWADEPSDADPSIAELTDVPPTGERPEGSSAHRPGAESTPDPEEAAPVTAFDGDHELESTEAVGMSVNGHRVAAGGPGTEEEPPAEADPEARNAPVDEDDAVADGAAGAAAEADGADEAAAEADGAAAEAGPDTIDPIDLTRAGGDDVRPAGEKADNGAASTAAADADGGTEGAPRSGRERSRRRAEPARPTAKAAPASRNRPAAASRRKRSTPARPAEFSNAVDDVFSRIKGDPVVEDPAGTTTGNVEPAVVPGDAGPETGAAAIGESGPTDAGKGGSAEPGAPDRAALHTRDAMLAGITRDLVRQLKLALSDEQNVVLDLARAAGSGRIRREDLPGGDQAATRYRNVARRELSAAFAAGWQAAFGPPGPDGDTGPVEQAPTEDGDLDAVVDELLTALTEPVRERLADLAGGDTDQPEEQVRNLYRETRNHRVAGVAEHATLSAHAAGQLAALRRSGAAGDGGTAEVRWVFEACTPDCLDNSLAGALPAGQPFPTGHLRPPAFAGCRCLLLGTRPQPTPRGRVTTTAV